MSQPCPLLSPPETEEQLLAQAQQLSGYTLGELAALAGLVTPEKVAGCAQPTSATPGENGHGCGHNLLGT
ncbi:hypothetical protein NE615_27185, partial [Escherichia coli]|nr:hypothetical protein [Escherichia coli]